MNLYPLLRRRVADEEPVRVGLVGAGKFGTMFLAQARTTPGIHVAAGGELSGCPGLPGLCEGGRGGEGGPPSPFTG